MITKNHADYKEIRKDLEKSCFSFTEFKRVVHFIPVHHKHFLRRGGLVCYNEGKEWKAREAREGSICLSREHLSFADGRSCI